MMPFRQRHHVVLYLVTHAHSSPVGADRPGVGANTMTVLAHPTPPASDRPEFLTSHSAPAGRRVRCPEPPCMAIVPLTPATL